MSRKFPKTWVLVADNAVARLFEWSQANENPVEFADFYNPEARISAAGLESDQPGRTFSSHGTSGGHPKQPTSSAQDKTARTFAHEIAGQLEKGRTTREYERLVLIAPPRFLGLLRAALNPNVTRLVSDSITSNLTRRSSRTIGEHLRSSARA